MAYTHKDNTGTLFNADKKSDKHPDFSGSAVIGGAEYWVAGWRKIKSDSAPMISLAFTRKDSAPKRNEAPKKGADHVAESLPDDLPF